MAIRWPVGPAVRSVGNGLGVDSYCDVSLPTPSCPRPHQLGLGIPAGGQTRLVCIPFGGHTLSGVRIKTNHDDREVAIVADHVLERSLTEAVIEKRTKECGEAPPRSER